MDSDADGDLGAVAAPGAAPSVRVGDIELGAGRPEIIVPLTGADRDAVLAQAARAASAPARLVEWRTDLYAPELSVAQHRERVLELLPAVRAAVGRRAALVLTLRTAAEGGARDLPDRDLADVLCAAVAAEDGTGQALVDLVDIETARDHRCVQQVIGAARERGVAVIGSHHDFAATPPRERILGLLRSQRALGADVPKVAVTPRSGEDVLTLLAASLEAARDAAGPHIAISMGSLGAVSRVAAEVFGSCATFATAGEASAPGQLAAVDVVQMLEALRP
jgi:3-dehydroquinate dehydratase-1